jgi:hypothetical protein
MSLSLIHTHGISRGHLRTSPSAGGVALTHWPPGLWAGFTGGAGHCESKDSILCSSVGNEKVVESPGCSKASGSSTARNHQQTTPRLCWSLRLLRGSPMQTSARTRRSSNRSLRAVARHQKITDNWYYTPNNCVETRHEASKNANLATIQVVGVLALVVL